MARERYIKLLLVACASLSFLAILLIFIFIFKESMPAITKAGFGNLFLSTQWNPDQGHYGMLAFLNGTILTTLGGLIIGAPLGIGTAIFLDQMAPKKMGTLIRRGVELLAGIPSVVIGWFGLIILVPDPQGCGTPGRNTIGCHRLVRPDHPGARCRAAYEFVRLWNSGGFNRIGGNGVAHYHSPHHRNPEIASPRAERSQPRHGSDKVAEHQERTASCRQRGNTSGRHTGYGQGYGRDHGCPDGDWKLAPANLLPDQGHRYSHLPNGDGYGRGNRSIPLGPFRAGPGPAGIGHASNHCYQGCYQEKGGLRWTQGSATAWLPLYSGGSAS